jgi:hypothetical protein
MLAAGSLIYVIYFVLLSVGCAALYYRTLGSVAAGRAATSPEFKSFQTLFLAVYLTMVTADWMQGPYVYALYSEYGFSKGDIGILFIAGFGSSLVFGTGACGRAPRAQRTPPRASSSPAPRAPAATPHAPAAAVPADSCRRLCGQVRPAAQLPAFCGAVRPVVPDQALQRLYHFDGRAAARRHCHLHPHVRV